MVALPSGPGQTDAAHSLSVVFANDAPPPARSTDGGQNIALAVGGTVIRASAAPCPSGFCAVSADPGNSAQVHVGRANTVTAGPTGKGIRLPAGTTIILPAADANEFYLVAATATQNVGLLAL